MCDHRKLRTFELANKVASCATGIYHKGTEAQRRFPAFAGTRLLHK